MWTLVGILGYPTGYPVSEIELLDCTSLGGYQYTSKSVGAPDAGQICLMSFASKNVLFRVISFSETTKIV
jgi:hypothetical protein